ncbi:MAG: hypothetical protein AAFQ66_18235 [Pseudomonadota bacterium]
MRGDTQDPKGLIRESYRIEGITEAECRSILVDWALSLGPGSDDKSALANLLEQHGSTAPDHPMTRLLQEGLTAISPSTGRRRGGRKARRAN